LLGFARRIGGPGVRPHVDVLVVCSSGGHLFDALAISNAWESRSRAWVSFDKPDVRSLLADERVYFARGPTNRNVPNLFRNLVIAWRVIASTRPRVVITTGAGVGVPFAWVGWLRGAQVVYVECSGRVDGRSLSGRLIGPVASRVYAQWPELAAGWRRARYAGNVLLTPVDGQDSRSRGSGVLVTVGTNEAPFDRLVDAAGTLTSEDVTVQYGASSTRPAGVRCFEYLSPGELARLVDATRVVVCHAGIGSVALALAHGKRPVVVPRLRRHGEAVDDHQVHFARKLEAAGLATVVENVSLLRQAVASDDHLATLEPGPDLTVEIRAALDELLEAGNDQRHPSWA
jgi:UDP-N-acetylglucosamine transferase subunit ALG13